MLANRQGHAQGDRLAVLNSRRLPARLNTSETALLLGFQEHDIAVLIATKLLEPLGKPARNAPKFFATVDVTTAGQDRDWLAKATRIIAKRWREKNNRKNRPPLSAAA
jgi:hypothetical protein